MALNAAIMKKILFISLKTSQPPLLLFNVLNLFKRVLEFNVMATVKLPSLNIYLTPQSVVEIDNLRKTRQTQNNMCHVHKCLLNLYIDGFSGLNTWIIVRIAPADSSFHVTSEVKLYNNCATAARPGHIEKQRRPHSISSRSKLQVEKKEK